LPPRVKAAQSHAAGMKECVAERSGNYRPLTGAPQTS
jgi:hypothetical protein